MQARFMIVCGAIVLAMSLASSGAWANATEPTADIKGARDNPLLKRYEGSYIVDTSLAAFDEFSLPLSVLEKTDKMDRSNNYIYAAKVSKTIEGRLTRLTYVNPAGRSPLEVIRNYEDEVQAKGGEILYRCKSDECGGDPSRGLTSGGGSTGILLSIFPKEALKAANFSNGACAVDSSRGAQRYMAGRVPTPAGDAFVAVLTYTITDGAPYCNAFTDRTMTVLVLVEPRQREQKMVTVGAEEMKNALDKDGRVALYGIQFDFDKAEIKPESRGQLDEIGKYLKANPLVKIWVVGHTDNQGAIGYNLDLSKRRAEAIARALTQSHGVAANRMQALGVASAAPVAANDDDAGRAKNRRVELVKQ